MGDGFMCWADDNRIRSYLSLIFIAYDCKYVTCWAGQSRGRGKMRLEIIEPLRQERQALLPWSFYLLRIWLLVNWETCSLNTLQMKLIQITADIVKALHCSRCICETSKKFAFTYWNSVWEMWKTSLWIFSLISLVVWMLVYKHFVLIWFVQ
jgi:hypothetical protein